MFRHFAKSILLPPATKLGQGYIFTRVCDSVHGGDGIPACIAGGIPACLAAGLQGGGSQHALQVSRPTSRGEVEGDVTRGGLQAHTQEENEGDLARGSPGPHPRGKLRGI